MIQPAQSLSEMSERAVRVLIRELGMVNTLRFLNQYRVGLGDYTKDRDELFAGKTAAELADDMQQWRKTHPRRATD
jgi:hypothetical protein